MNKRGFHLIIFYCPSRIIKFILKIHYTIYKLFTIIYPISLLLDRTVLTLLVNGGGGGYYDHRLFLPHITQLKHRNELPILIDFKLCPSPSSFKKTLKALAAPDFIWRPSKVSGPSIFFNFSFINFEANLFELLGSLFKRPSNTEFWS